MFKVIDGKDKLENQLMVLHQRNQKLRKHLNQAMKLAYQNAMNTAPTNENALSGLTLGG